MKTEILKSGHDCQMHQHANIADYQADKIREHSVIKKGKQDKSDKMFESIDDISYHFSSDEDDQEFNGNHGVKNDKINNLKFVRK